MLKTQDLIDELGEDYKLMLSKINIPDFTKCIAYYSGIELKYLSDEVIKDYLTCWARNKKHIFEFLGNNIRVDLPFEYQDNFTSTQKKILNIANKYPVYYYWLRLFSTVESNKITRLPLFEEDQEALKRLFPGYNLIGTSLTRFFKNKLDAPDSLITELGKIWEYEKVEGTYTLSIDPVDIMLSSENPYSWTSCYRLDPDYEGTCADGCLAGVIDSSTIVTYFWNEEGKFSLKQNYIEYVFKKIRYKRARMTIAVNNTFTAIHFNRMYPWEEGTDNCSEDLKKKQVRKLIEDFFAKQLNLKEQENI